MPRVLYVSKPIVPPWHDGSKNLVRDVATSLTRHRATVLTSEGVAPPDGVDGLVAYGDAARGRFAPTLRANARVAAVVAASTGHSIWHFVFAPNWPSSSAARMTLVAGRLRGVRRVVQTIASRPKHFRSVGALLFGDVVVCLSEWTRGRFLAAGVDGRKLVVVPPCARPLRDVAPEEGAALRERLEVGDAPLVVYPGDLEVSRGARSVAAAIAALADRVPEARVIFACRAKTSGAVAAEQALRASLTQSGVLDRVRFVGELPELAVLLAEASVVALPADDLYGKVDVPLAVIEALALGVPLVLARGGPLETVTTASFVDAADTQGLADALVRLLESEAARAEQAAAGKALYARVFRPEVIAARYEEIYEG